MDIYSKYIVTYEKKSPTFWEKITKKRETLEVWAPSIINGFRDKVNTEIFRIILITPTDEKMEVFWRSGI